MQKKDESSGWRFMIWFSLGILVGTVILKAIL